MLMHISGQQFGEAPTALRVLRDTWPSRVVDRHSELHSRPGPRSSLGCWRVALRPTWPGNVGERLPHLHVSDHASGWQSLASLLVASASCVCWLPLLVASPRLLEPRLWLQTVSRFDDDDDDDDDDDHDDADTNNDDDAGDNDTPRGDK